MQIIWSKNAQITFDAIVVYLENTFGNNVAKKFIAKADSSIQTIASFPNLYKAISLKQNVRKATIRKVCSFYYELNDNTIVILYFWDNRHEPIDF